MDTNVYELDLINALDDIADTFDYAIEHDIDIDELETVDEMKERFMLDLMKHKGRKLKEEVDKFAIIRQVT